jgi:hypothetical protein
MCAGRCCLPWLSRASGGFGVCGVYACAGAAVWQSCILLPCSMLFQASRQVLGAQQALYSATDKLSVCLGYQVIWLLRGQSTVGSACGMRARSAHRAVLFDATCGAQQGQRRQPQCLSWLSGCYGTVSWAINGWPCMCGARAVHAVLRVFATTCEGGMCLCTVIAQYTHHRHHHTTLRQLSCLYSAPADVTARQRLYPCITCAGPRPLACSSHRHLLFTLGQPIPYDRVCCA